MKAPFLIITALFSIMMISCKSKQKTDTTGSQTSANNTTSSTTETNSNYRFIVSFISIGTGIDADAFSKFEKFVQTNPKKPAYEQKRWGREGETDYMFQLKEFKSSEQAKFISDLKAAIGKSERVQYKEYEKSR